ncbi:M48 family metalloprotease [candidate division GN15 bacterium]|nr:M48 family metalloprotease [candidate division GN15 bacterium]
MKRAVIGLTILMGLWLILGMIVPGLPVAQEVTSDEASATPAVTSEPTRSETEAALYPMSHERKELLISYSQFTNQWRFISFGLGILTLAILLVTGLSAKFRTWAYKARRRFFVIFIFFALIMIADYLLNFPASYYRNFVIEHEYGFSNQTFQAWLWDDIKGLLITLVLGVFPVWFFYWLVGYMKRWWLAFTLGAIPFIIALVVVAPVVISPLFNDFTKIEDPQLESRLLELAGRAGIDDPAVLQVNASEQSSKLNAYVTGLFGTKRIVLYDTMIDNFTYDEILFVMGHEMGHYVMNHVWWGVGITIVFMLFALWLMDLLIHPVIRRFRRAFKFDSLEDIASLPLVLIFVSIITFAFQPVTNSASRYMEHQADIYGMEIAGVPGETAAIAFDKLSVFNLSDPNPPELVEFWFYSHPALSKRMEFVRSYQPTGQL